MKTKPLSILPHDPSQETLLVAWYLLHLVIFNLQKQWFSNLGEYENHQGDLMKIQMPRPCLPLMRLICMFFISSPLKFENHWSKSSIYRYSIEVSGLLKSDGGAIGGAPNSGTRTQPNLTPLVLAPALECNARRAGSHERHISPRTSVYYGRRE